jgi:hypothetical protein
MLLFVEGFDHFLASDIGKKWPGLVVGQSYLAMGSGRFGGQSLLCPNNVAEATGVTRNLGANYSTLIAGFAFKTATKPTNSNYVASVFSFQDGTTPQLNVRVNEAGNLIVARNNTTIATSAYALPVNSWVYIEFKATIHASAGSYEVRVNGVNVLSATNVNTMGSSTANINTITLGPVHSAIGFVFSNTWSYDDFYLCDTTGTKNNDFLGDMRVDTIRPNGAGTNTQLTSPAAFGAHRYWRIFFPDTQGGGIVVTEVQLRTVAAGPNVATGGVASANSYASVYSPANAFDGNGTSVWFNGSNNSNWLQYDFGVGSQRDIREFTVTNTYAPGMATIDSSPKNMSLQYSDDGTKWTTLYGTPTQNAWNFNETRTFTVSLPTNSDMMNKNTMDAATYLTGVAAEMKDTYAFSNLMSLTGTVKGVQVSNVSAKSDAGPRSVANVVLASGTESQSTPQSLTATQMVYTSIHENNPATSAAWTVNAINAAEFGVVAK